LLQNDEVEVERMVLGVRRRVKRRTKRKERKEEQKEE